VLLLGTLVQFAAGSSIAVGRAADPGSHRNNDAAWGVMRVAAVSACGKFLHVGSQLIRFMMHSSVAVEQPHRMRRFVRNRSIREKRAVGASSSLTHWADRAVRPEGTCGVVIEKTGETSSSFPTKKNWNDFQGLAARFLEEYRVEQRDKPGDGWRGRWWLV